MQPGKCVSSLFYAVYLAYIMRFHSSCVHYRFQGVDTSFSQTCMIFPLSLSAICIGFGSMLIQVRLYSLPLKEIRLTFF